MDDVHQGLLWGLAIGLPSFFFSPVRLGCSENIPEKLANAAVVLSLTSTWGRGLTKQRSTQNMGEEVM